MNENQDRSVIPNSIWKHFKGSIAVVIAVAKHTETNEDLVIYNCINPNENSKHTNGIYARPIDMFLSEVDHKKYPNILQRYRFERI